MTDKTQQAGVQEASAQTAAADAAVLERGLDEAANVRYLRPEDVQFLRTPAGCLRVRVGDERTLLRVKARRCFPFAEPDRFISIRDGADQEVGIIRNLPDFPPQVREWVREALEFSYFTPRVTAILSIRQRWGGVEWHVRTDAGPKRFITRGVHDTAREIHPGRTLVTDVDGNRYEIPENDLSEADRRLLDRLL